MKLWEYLREKMLPHADKVAFARSGITYRELSEWNEQKNIGALRVCTGANREEQAISILRCIAAGDVAVPASLEYGAKQYCRIAEAVTENRELYPELAFLMFTSGTTGKPKGVMLSDRNIITNLEYIDGYFRIEGLRSICIARPLLHIAVLTGELLYALCKGLTIYFYEESFMPRRLLAFLEQNKIDVFCATPTLYATLAKAKHTELFPVKVSALSGEVLSVQAGDFLSENFPQTAFYNVYGLTEHSPRVSALLPEEFKKKPNSIGRPIGGAEMKIEDGELLVRSPCVMEGYFQDDAATREKIRDGWLHTGDMAHADEDGYYYIDGRKDDMIIRAGLNIYPAEIENAAKDCSGVEDCIAFGRKTEEGNTEIVLKYEGRAVPALLRRELVQKLNPHAMPNKFEQVEKLERTPSGKKVRK